MVQINELKDNIYRLNDDITFNDNDKRNKESQLEDIMNMYKKVCDENETYKQNQENLSREVIKVEGIFNQIQNDNEELKNELSSRDIELNYYKEQIDQLNNKILEQSRNIT